MAGKKHMEMVGPLANSHWTNNKSDAKIVLNYVCLKYFALWIAF